MDAESAVFLLIAWIQITGFAECFSEKSFDRFFGMLHLGLSTLLLLTTDWWLKA